jgi:hypothetical protein
MARQQRRVMQFDDLEGNHLHAVWSRSGKRLIVTVTGRAGQIELEPEQAQELRQFLSDTVSEEPTNR